MRVRISGKQFNRAIQHRSQRGFTVLEMLIATAIFMIVATSLYQILEVGRSGRFSTTQRAELLQNARIALNSMSRDALDSGVGYPNAGATLPDGALVSLLGIPAGDGSTTFDRLTPIVPGDGLRAVNGAATDQITFVYLDDSFNNGNPLPLSGGTPSGSQLRIDTTKQPGGNSVCKTGDLYIIEGTTGTALGWVTNVVSTDKINFASNDPLNINQPSASNGVIASIGSPISASKITWSSYYVSSNGTLIRHQYGDPGTLAGTGSGDSSSGSNTGLDMPVAQGVEDLQIQYILADGSVSDSPTNSQFQNIRQVRITLTVRSPEIDPRNGKPMRVTLSGTFSTRNLGYEER